MLLDEKSSVSTIDVGDMKLSPIEAKVVDGLVEGLSEREIAAITRQSVLAVHRCTRRLLRMLITKGEMELSRKVTLI